MEGSPYTDYAHFDAAYNQGWIARESKFMFWLSLLNSNALTLFEQKQLIKIFIIISYSTGPIQRNPKNVHAYGNEAELVYLPGCSGR